jgi:hypothetical protein
MRIQLVGGSHDGEVMDVPNQWRPRVAMIQKHEPQVFMPDEDLSPTGAMPPIEVYEEASPRWIPRGAQYYYALTGWTVTEAYAVAVVVHAPAVRGFAMAGLARKLEHETADWGAVPIPGTTKVADCTTEYDETRDQSRLRMSRLVRMPTERWMTIDAAVGGGG